MPFDALPRDPFDDDDREWLNRVLARMSLGEILALLVAIAVRHDDGSIALRDPLEPWRRQP